MSNIHIQQGIDEMGGPVLTALMLGAPTYQAVQRWVKRGVVPAPYCRAFSNQTGKRLSQLRPHDHHLIWPGVELLDVNKYQLSAYKQSSEIEGFHTQHYLVLIQPCNNNHHKGQQGDQ